MSNSRRCQIDIMCDILKVCQERSRKTRIVYCANLNFSRANQYLKTLLGLGYITRDERFSDGVYYRTAEEGRNFLENYLEMKGKAHELLLKERTSSFGRAHL
ncbi:MAG: winged helix-turn-helix domain-containing protein [Candidatus Hodarchaeota archaeon]